MKRSAIVVAASAVLVAAGCQIDSSSPVTGGQDRFILKGKVTALNGTTALQSVTVQVLPFGSCALTTLPQPIRLMQTDASGNYRTFGIASGTYCVRVVMGDSSVIGSTSYKDTVYVGVSADSTIVPTITYDAGRIISGSVTWTFQDTSRSLSIALGLGRVRLFKCLAASAAACTGAVVQGATYTQIDSQLTSATGAVRFPLRPTTLGVFYLKFDTTGFRAKADPDVPSAAIVDTLRLTGITALSGASANVTSTVSGSLTYRSPYLIRARIFKDKNNNGVFDTGDSVVSGVRVWLRKAGGTINLGSGPVTSGTGVTATGNITIPGTTGGLHTTPANGWALHVLTWWLPSGCTLVNGNDVTATADLVTGTAAAKDLPLKCS